MNGENKDMIISAEAEEIKATEADIDAAEISEETLSEEGAAPAADAAEAPAVEAGESVEAVAENEESEFAEGTEEDDGGCAQAEPAQGGADDNSAEISDADMRRIMADPMFICFAKGKTQDIASLCKDFCFMLGQGESAREKSNLSSSVLMRVTPGGGAYGGGVVLTERQRALARSAGMSYREYYDLISGIPEHTRKKQ